MAVIQLTGDPFANIPEWLWVEIKIVTPDPMDPDEKKEQEEAHVDNDRLQETLIGLVNKTNQIIVEIGTIPEQIIALQSQVDSLQSQVDTLTTTLSSHANELFSTGVHGHTTGGGGAPPPPPSDRRLKYDINLIGKSPSGLNIYTFRFKDSYRYGDSLYQGVMSDEVTQTIVTQDNHGYDMVDYNQIDVDFIKISE